MIIVQICVGSSCHLKGAPEIVEMLPKEVAANHLEDEVILTGSFCTGKCNRIGVTIAVDDEVYTGVTVMKDGSVLSRAERSLVTFRELDEREIDAYIATKEPMDKAGSYGVQSGAAPFVEKICGDYYNVVGLPVCRLSQILEQLKEDSL